MGGLYAKELVNKPNQWHPVADGSCVAQTSTDVCDSDPPEHQPMEVVLFPYPLFQIDYLGCNFYYMGSNPWCCTFPLASACAYMGLTHHEAVMSHSARLVVSKQGVNRFKFACSRMVLKSYDGVAFKECRRVRIVVSPILELPVPNIVAMRLCASPEGVNFHNRAYYDKTHIVAVVDNMIFDANKRMPLDLNDRNLDACCVQGPPGSTVAYKFHHVSEAVEFVPNEKMDEFLKRVWSRRRQDSINKRNRSLKRRFDE